MAQLSNIRFLSFRQFARFSPVPFHLTSSFVSIILILKKRFESIDNDRQHSFSFLEFIMNDHHDHSAMLANASTSTDAHAHHMMDHSMAAAHGAVGNGAPMKDMMMMAVKTSLS